MQAPSPCPAVSPGTTWKTNTKDSAHLREVFWAIPAWTTPEEVSRLGAVLAADGFDPVTKKQLISAKTSHTVRALIAGCGLYEQTGAYNIAAGIPAKSGSSGVIVAAARKKAGIAVFSPGLDPIGNSVRGLKALSYLSEKLDLRTM